MRFTSWIRAEIRDWLGVEPKRLGIENGAISFNAPHPDKVEGREQFAAFMRNPWTIGIGSALVAAILFAVLVKLF
jgi:hypothetical protein